MTKSITYIDVLLVVACLLLVGQVWFWPVIGDFILPLNINLALLFFFISLLFRVNKNFKGQVLSFILLMVFGLKIFPVALVFDQTNIVHASVNLSIGFLKFDPVVMCMIILYIAVYRVTLGNYWRSVFYPSDTEKDVDFNKKKDFYYDKFNNCTKDEFDKLYANFSSYPPEAQAAFTRITEERTDRKTT